MITHDLGVIADMCDEIIVMYAGSVCERGTVDEIFYNPRHEYTRGSAAFDTQAGHQPCAADTHIGFAGRPDQYAQGLSVCGALRQVHEDMPDRASAGAYHKRRPQRSLLDECKTGLRRGGEGRRAAVSEHILEVKDLKQYFPVSTGWFKKTPLKAVDGVSFTIDKGETLGLVGESGCGKTTVGRTHTAPVHAYVGRCDIRRHEDYAAQCRALSQGYADSVPGSVLFAQPAHDGRGHSGRAAGHSPPVQKQP